MQFVEAQTQFAHLFTIYLPSRSTTSSLLFHFRDFYGDSVIIDEVHGSKAIESVCGLNV